MWCRSADGQKRSVNCRLVIGGLKEGLSQEKLRKLMVFALDVETHEWLLDDARVELAAITANRGVVNGSAVEHSWPRRYRTPKSRIRRCHYQRFRT